MIESCFVCLFGKPNIDIWCRYRITVSHAVSLLVWRKTKKVICRIS